MDYEKKICVAEVPEAILEDGAKTGLLKMRNVDTGSVDQVVITISRDVAISLYPASVRFSKTESLDELAYVGSIVVHDKAADDGKSPHARFSINGIELPAKVKRSKGGVTFYRILLNDEKMIAAASDGKAKIRCKVTGSTAQSEHLIPVIFPAVTRNSKLGEK